MGSIKTRKDDHLRICLEEDVSSGVSTGLEAFHLEYDALPEIDLEDVDLSTTVLDCTLQAPVLIASMTGGSEWAEELNTRIAKAAAKFGLGVGVGSQRAMLKHPETTSSYQLRQKAPDIPLLLGNIGAVQLNYGVGPDEIQQLVDTIEADGTYFHLNPLQEAIQPEGDTRFSDLHKKMKHVIEALPFPCLVKEVGAGISKRTASKLAKLPLAGVEASGLGGTSWTRVERYRADKASPSAQIGEELKGFGISMVDSLFACREAFPHGLVIAAGGIRTGHDIALALALGADAVSIAKPVLIHAAKSQEALEHYLSILLHELKVIAFCTGSADIEALKQVHTLRK